MPILRFMNVGYSVLDTNNQIYKSSGRFSPGFGLNAELFLTEKWFLETMFVYQIHTFTPQDGISTSF